LLFGLGWPQWLTIIGLVGGLLLTFWLMARASVAYEQARQRRESAASSAPDEGTAMPESHGEHRKEER
jgi:hypothetical protein